MLASLVAQTIQEHKALARKEGEIMSGTTSVQRALPTHNRAGCPYLNQTGREAVQHWAVVLMEIDPQSLPPDLRIELQQLRGACELQERAVNE